MANRISGFGGSPGGTTIPTRPASDGWTRTNAQVSPGRRWEGNINGFRGRVNLAGPFDPDAPRGTYLDIMV